MNNPVYVTGMGIVSNLGSGIESHFRALETGVSNMTPRELIGEGKSRPVGYFPMSDEEIRENLGLRDISSRTALIGCLAAKQAVRDAEIDLDRHKRIGLISGTTVDIMDSYEQKIKRGERIDMNSFKTNSTKIIADSIGQMSYLCTISTACTSSANAIVLGARLIDSGFLDCAIVGGCDALCEFTFKGFSSLELLDEYPCRPFDRDRNGLNLGEGAAYLVIESGNTSHKQPYCIISAGSNKNDAYHSTGVSPTGIATQLSINECLAEARLNPSDIHYVNMHGTGTKNNDFSEMNALVHCFGDHQIPDFSSTKEYTGHTLGASGAIEAVFSIIALKERLVFPNRRFATLINEFSISPVRELKRNPEMNCVLSNSLGFGGNNVAIIFEKIKQPQ